MQILSSIKYSLSWHFKHYDLRLMYFHRCPSSSPLIPLYSSSPTCSQEFTTTATVTKTTSITPCWQWASEWTARGGNSGSWRTGGTRRHQVAHKGAEMKPFFLSADLIPPVVHPSWWQPDDLKWLLAMFTTLTCLSFPHLIFYLFFFLSWQLERYLGKAGLHLDGTKPR